MLLAEYWVIACVIPVVAFVCVLLFANDQKHLNRYYDQRHNHFTYHDITNRAMTLSLACFVFGLATGDTDFFSTTTTTPTTTTPLDVVVLVVYTVLIVLLNDLLQWTWHVACHLWRPFIYIHLEHHLIRRVTPMTAFYYHPIEFVVVWVLLPFGAAYIPRCTFEAAVLSLAYIAATRVLMYSDRQALHLVGIHQSGQRGGNYGAFPYMVDTTVQTIQSRFLL